MKYENPLISCGGSTMRTSTVEAVILPSLRGTVRTTSLRSTVKIVGTKTGRAEGEVRSSTENLRSG
jgi:hypothetical protein